MEIDINIEEARKFLEKLQKEKKIIGYVPELESTCIMLYDGLEKSVIKNLASIFNLEMKIVKKYRCKPYKGDGPYKWTCEYAGITLYQPQPKQSKRSLFSKLIKPREYGHAVMYFKKNTKKSNYYSDIEIYHPNGKLKFSLFDKD